MRSEGYRRAFRTSAASPAENIIRRSVAGSVCLSVKSHLTYGASVRPENAVTYSSGNEGQKVCGVFSETPPLPRSSTPSIMRPCVQSAIYLTHTHYSMGLAAPPPSAAAGLFAFATSCPAQRGKTDAASLRGTGSVDRYTPPVGPCPIE